MYQLLDFQKKAVADIKAKFLSGATRVLCQSATGSGKTLLASQFIKEYLTENKTARVLVLLNLQVLVGQTYDTLKAFGVQSSVLHDLVTRNAAGERLPLDYRRRTLITMPETFINTRAGANQLERDLNWKPNLIVIDEAHKGTSQIYQMIREMFPEATILGLTATPYREKNEEGEHLTEWYGDNLITTVSIQELIEIGRLVRPIYIEQDADDHVVDTWVERTMESDIKSTIVFTRDTKHSYELCDAFRASGITAEVITAVGDEDRGIAQQTPGQRQEIYNRFNAGELDVLISVSALCEGFDSQRAKFCFLCRGVGNHALYHQMLGRVLRAYLGKEAGYIVDFCDNLKDHGPIEHYQWSLEQAGPSLKHLGTERRISAGEYGRRNSISVRCLECNHVYDIKKTKTCVHCGTAHGVVVAAEIGELLEGMPDVIRKAANFNAAKDRIRQVLRQTKPEDRRMFCQIVNKKLELELFDLATLDLKPEYEYMRVIAEENKMLGDRITFGA